MISVIFNYLTSFVVLPIRGVFEENRLSITNWKSLFPMNRARTQISWAQWSNEIGALKKCLPRRTLVRALAWHAFHIVRLLITFGLWKQKSHVFTALTVVSTLFHLSASAPFFYWLFCWLNYANPYFLSHPNRIYLTNVTLFFLRENFFALTISNLLMIWP